MTTLLSLLLTLATVVSYAGAFAPAAGVQRRTATTRLFSEAAAEGFVKQVFTPGNGAPLKRGDIATVKYSCYLPDSPPFARSEGQRMVRVWYVVCEQE